MDGGVAAFEAAGIQVAETMDEIVAALSSSLHGQIQELAAGLKGPQVGHVQP